MRPPSSRSPPPPQVIPCGGGLGFRAASARERQERAGRPRQGKRRAAKEVRTYGVLLWQSWLYARVNMRLLARLPRTTRVEVIYAAAVPEASLVPTLLNVARHPSLSCFPSSVPLLPRGPRLRRRSKKQTPATNPRDVKGKIDVLAAFAELDVDKKTQGGVRDERHVREEACAAGRELHAAQDRLRRAQPGAVLL